MHIDAPWLKSGPAARVLALLDCQGEEARVVGGMVETPVGRIDAGGLADGSMASVAVRLTGFEPVETDGDAQARILSRRYLGVEEMLELAVAGAEKPVRARLRCGILPASARDIWLKLRPADVLVFESRGENA